MLLQKTQQMLTFTSQSGQKNLVTKFHSSLSGNGALVILLGFEPPPIIELGIILPTTFKRQHAEGKKIR